MMINSILNLEDEKKRNGGDIDAYKCQEHTVVIWMRVLENDGFNLLSFYNQLITRRPLIYYAGTWTALLTLTVAIASFSPEMAFVSAISPSSAYSRSCDGEGRVRIPLDLPGERLCFPSNMVKRSGFDIFIPTVFAGLIVAGSALVLRSLDLWQNEA
ncbi:hypothetical protein Ancab_011668 [Ancistrocladus abbreviatus]